ncbi:MAG TPA: insulinase family protein, partial [Acidobacteriota bacterium]|nr:insulinase family protein [Acidobacteriota bacterium]
SRLYRKMVYDNNWVTAVYSGPNQYKGPELFTVWCQLQNGNPSEQIYFELLEELWQAAETLVLDQELEKARNNIEYAFAARLSKISQIGESLANYAVFLDDPNLINTEIDRFLAVSADDIRAAAERVFTPHNQTAIFVLPEGGVR